MPCLQSHSWLSVIKCRIFSLRSNYCNKYYYEIFNCAYFICRSHDNGFSDSSDSGRGRSWASVQNLPEAASNLHADYALTLPAPRPSSWTSSPDLQRLQGERNAEVTVNVRLPPPAPRKATENVDADAPSFTLRRPSSDNKYLNILLRFILLLRFRLFVHKILMFIYVPYSKSTT